MNASLDIPYWLAIPLFILAMVALLDRLLLPPVRWFLRRRMNRVIDGLNDRLHLGIQPFKLTRRKIMVDRLIHDPKVMEAVVDHAKSENIPQEVAHDTAERYAKEIVPSFSALTYFGFGTKAARFISNALFRVRLGFMSDEALRDIASDTTVIFVMNHRSNMDYVLVTFLAAERSALSYAVGEWARVWPLQQIIRSMGAYFIRRKSRNPLYRRVLARYVQLATEGGVTQAIFPEGGLSRDGKLAEPKLGLLSYILGDFRPDISRDVVFIPVGLNYDRVLEDRVLTSPPDQKTSFSPMVFFQFMAKQLWLRVTGKFYRFGYACVSFGRPISLKAYLQDNPINDQTIADLGSELMTRIGRVIPVLPVSLVARVLLQADAPMSLLEIKAKCHSIWQELSERDIYSHLPHEDEDYAVDVGLRMLTLRKFVILDEGKYGVNSADSVIVEYYANAISHHF